MLRSLLCLSMVFAQIFSAIQIVTYFAIPILSMHSSIHRMGNVSILVTEFTLRPFVHKLNVHSDNNTSRTQFTLTGFYKVIIQQILNFFSEHLLFYRVHSVWMLFHRG